MVLQRTWTSAEIREAFLRFFEDRGHTRVASSPLVPADDPTLLFTNAGMVQFKDVFTGERRVPYSRATTAQKCVRAGGKHNDLDTVGKTARHHTFFEMLGNFSFGDYFKRDAVAFAWELSTEVFGLPKERLWATVYLDDDEAAGLWQEIAGLPAERVVRLGEKDNFWAMGDTGPCGPCSELHLDRGAEFACDAPECAVGACDCDRWLEVWNLVFMQYERGADGTLTPLPKPSVDTGMGLERLASLLQGVDTNWDTDLFVPLLKQVGAMCGRPYEFGAKPGSDAWRGGFPFRVVADHARACTFLVADGVMPSNEGRGYVLRRILRRAVRFGRTLGLERPFLCELVPTVVEVMGRAYPGLQVSQDFVAEVVRQEEEQFGRTLSQGMALLDELVAAARAEGRPGIAGEDAFRLHDTFGFPLDLTVDAAEDAGLSVDRDGFERAMAAQRQRARSDRRQKAGAGGSGGWAEGLPPTRFLGYGQLHAESRVLALAANDGGGAAAAAPAAAGGGAAGAPVARERLGEGDQGFVVLAATPFYAESGGQVGDTGLLEWAQGRAEVLDTQKEAGVFRHEIRVTHGSLKVGDTVAAQVDETRRRRIMRNHSATHLLHRALKDVLGEQANQAGSLVAPDRLRFDFTALSAPSEAQLADVEQRVNAAVLASDPVVTREMPIDEAKALGAMALFGEKYGDVVRVVQMGRSLELCGGTHLDNTAGVGLFQIVSQGSVGSGIRRIEAATGDGALAYVRGREMLLREAAAALNAPEGELPERVRAVAAHQKDLERELAALRARSAADDAAALAASAEDLAGVPLVVAEATTADAEALRALADAVRDRLAGGAVVLAAKGGAGVVILAACSKEAVQRGVHAGKVAGRAAKEVGGGGGGRPDFAQAGGRRVDGMAKALAAAREELARQLQA